MIRAPERRVYIHKSNVCEYPKAPFNPPEIYPEFYGRMIIEKIDASNKVYECIRTTLMGLRFDKENIDTPNWNPFKDFVRQGDKIIIKPNLVRDVHPLGFEGILSMVTHPSVIRPIIDYILLAIEGECEIVICDVSLHQTNWAKLIKTIELDKLIDYYKNKGANISLLDLREEIAYVNEDNMIYKRVNKISDPLGYTTIDLKDKSALMPIIKHYEKLEITDYSPGTVSQHHNSQKNEYCIPKTILSADVFINVPKLKTHQKAGITVAMKNLIGINADKSWIAHHRRGSQRMGGDEYDKFRAKAYLKWHIWAFLKRHRWGIWTTKYVKRTYQKLILKGKKLEDIKVNPKKREIMEGNWHGNDTVWRCIKDINNILFFADKEGKMTGKKQRRYLSIVDGIIAGEKEGPMDCLPRKAGIVIGGFNSVAVDYAAAWLMGFDWEKIPQIREGFKNEYFELAPFKPGEINFFSNIDSKNLNLQFKPSIGWKGYVERL